jgi:acyl carrier protein
MPDMNTIVDVKDKINNYIIKNTLANVDQIADDTLIFESGLLDSMGLLFLIEFLNEEFGIETHDEELVVENFESINSIVAFVESKQ